MKNLFRITATIVLRGDTGWVSTRQVPQFWLDGDCHGLLDEDDAREFAESFLSDVNPKIVTMAVIAVREIRPEVK